MTKEQRIFHRTSYALRLFHALCGMTLVYQNIPKICAYQRKRLLLEETISLLPLVEIGEKSSHVLLLSWENIFCYTFSAYGEVNPILWYQDLNKHGIWTSKHGRKRASILFYVYLLLRCIWQWGPFQHLEMKCHHHISNYVPLHLGKLSQLEHWHNHYICSHL